MILKKTRIACRSGHRVAHLPKMVQQRHSRLGDGRKVTDMLDGYLLRTSRRKNYMTTTMVDLPVYVRSGEIETIPNFGNTYLGSFHNRFDREALYPEPRGTTPVPLRVDSGAIETAVVLGSAVAPGAYTKATYGGDIATPIAGAPVRAITRLRSDEDFWVSRDQQELLQPLVSEGVQLWLDTELWYLNGVRRRVTMSEQWLQVMAPGYRLISTAHELTVPMPVTHCVGDGVGLVFAVALRKQRGPYDAFDPITNSGNTRDRGHTALLTFRLQPVDEAMVVSWYHLWELETETDPRLKTVAYPTDTSDVTIVSGSPSERWLGVAPNDILVNLAIRPDGTVEALCHVYTSRTAIDEAVPYNMPDIRRGTYMAQSVVHATWSNGAFTRVVKEAVLFMSRVTYDYLAANPNNLQHIADVVAFADLFSVGTVDKTQDVAAFYTHTTPGVFDTPVRYLLTAAVIALSTYAPSDPQADPDGWVSLTTGLDDVGVYYVFQPNKGIYAVYNPTDSVVDASWAHADTDLTPAGGSVIDRSRAGRGAVTGYFATATAVGEGAYATLTVDTVAQQVRLAELSVYGDQVPRVMDLPDSAGGGQLSCYQRKLVADVGGTVAVNQNSGLCYGSVLGCYVSGDGGTNWEQVSANPSDFATVVVGPLWSRAPYTLIET